ncbi:MAG: Surface lipoprotein [uncultured bacterium (gcode 4)]|uniref:Surface lipoprotein n=1 Tax=uncultured bacterium (gcode 4) TaxID=1234023 RepID=K2AX20_9BACT|nr:MAG: Surface lipoprotein [uncultured bacterium (gcode 4)]
MLFCSGMVLLVSAGQTMANQNEDDMVIAESEADAKARAVYDPAEPVNRVSFEFNDGFYHVVTRPVTNVYEFLIPQFARTAISNASRNIKAGSRFAGNLMQGNIKGMMVEPAAFIINTSFGIGGLIEVVKVSDYVPPQDISSGLASLGVGDGPYMVVPVAGPFNVRTLIGSIGNAALNPICWLESPDDIIVNTGDNINGISIVDAYDELTKDSVDKYASVKAGYSDYYRKQSTQKE